MEVWVLSPPENTHALVEWDEGVDFDGSITCTVNEGHMRAKKRSSRLRVVSLSKSPNDFLWTWLTECLISDRVLQLLRQRGFTGFQSKAATVRTPTGVLTDRYFELIVTGWGGMAPQASGIQLIKECEACGHKVYSTFNKPAALFDESQWDGSDFFILWPLPRFIMVSDSAYRCIVDAGFKGVCFSRVSELQFDPDDTLTPGFVSDWLSDKPS